MAEVLPFPDRNPRCASCIFWTPRDGRSPIGFCERKEEQTNSDYHCLEHKTDKEAEMTRALPYLFRWERHGRKGHACAVTARSKAQPGETPLLAFGRPARPRFNSVRLEFADGFSTITSGNAIRRRR